MPQLSPLQELVEIILDEVKTEKIFLLNSMPDKRGMPLSYTRNMFGCFVYKILILAKGTRKRYEDIRINIRCRYQGATPIDIVIWPAPYFKKLLSEKNDVAVSVQMSCVLYDFNDDRRALQEAKDLNRSDKWLTNMRNDLAMYFNIGMDFLEAAEVHLSNKAFRLAAFCLHQAMEYFVSTVAQIMYGYRATVHNINELHRFSTSFLPELSVIMPHHHDRQKRIHKILYRAYESQNKLIPEAELYAIAVDLHNIQKVIRGVIPADPDLEDGK